MYATFLLKSNKYVKLSIVCMYVCMYLKKKTYSDFEKYLQLERTKKS